MITILIFIGFKSAISSPISHTVGILISPELIDFLKRPIFIFNKMNFNKCNKDILISPFMIEDMNILELTLIPLLLLTHVVVMTWIVVDIIKYETNKGK